MSNILVVEDDPSTQKLITHILRKEGYYVMTANDAREALEMDLDAPPDLLLTDRMMPGMDGFKLVEELKSEYATAFIRVILLTSCNSAKDIETGLNAGADDYITKPFDHAILLARVRSQLRTKALLDKILRENEILKDRIAASYQEIVPLPWEREGRGPESRDLPEPKVPTWPEELKKIGRQGIRDVLFVCKANLVRSPLAELLFKNILHKSGITDIQCGSAALNLVSGDRLKDSVVQAFSGMNINLARHRSRSITEELARKADIILAMEGAHKEKLTDLFPFCQEKVFLLSLFRTDGSEVRDIQDPIKKSVFDYRLCYHDISLSIVGFMEFLKNTRRAL